MGLTKTFSLNFHCGLKNRSFNVCKFPEQAGDASKICFSNQHYQEIHGT